MTTLRTAAQQALEALESSRVFVTSREKIKHPEGTEWYDERIAALRAALAQEQAEPVQEPVALVRTWHKGEEQHAELLDWGIGIDALPDGEHTLYTAPHKLVPLTDEEIDAATASPRDALLDLIYEYGTTVEGVLERIRKLCRAVERALEEKNRGR